MGGSPPSRQRPFADGELVAGQGRTSDFYRLVPQLARRRGAKAITFVAFDVLHLVGRVHHRADVAPTTPPARPPRGQPQSLTPRIRAPWDIPPVWDSMVRDLRAAGRQAPSRARCQSRQPSRGRPQPNRYPPLEIPTRRDTAPAEAGAGRSVSREQKATLEPSPPLVPPRPARSPRQTWMGAMKLPDRNRGSACSLVRRAGCLS